MEERVIETTRVYEGRMVNLRVDDVELTDGRRTSRVVVEHPGAVAIVAWDGTRIALVRQWRHPTGGELLELPAGTLGRGEAPLTAAARELAEESGLAAGQWAEGPRFYTAPGFCDEYMHLFLATDLTDAPSVGDDDEEIEPSWATLHQALSWIEDGGIADGKSIAGILWLARRLEHV